MEDAVTLTEARQAGYEAAVRAATRDRLSAVANPHPPGSAAARAWEDGFDAGWAEATRTPRPAGLTAGRLPGLGLEPLGD